MAQEFDHNAIVRLGMAYAESKTLLSAVELGVFTELAKGPLDWQALRERIGIHPRAARDFFDALVALRLLRRESGRYSNTPETDLFLDRAKRTYIGGMLEMSNARLYRIWGSLTDALRTGEPKNEVAEGEDIFTWLAKSPEKYREFTQAMTGLSLPSARAIAAKFPWEKYKTFADVGTAQGGLPVQVALAHPHVKGIGLDLAPVQPVFEGYVRDHGLADRLRFQVFDLFRDAIPQVDVITMGHILHGWSLTDKRSFIKKAYDALPQGGVLVVYDAMIDDDRSENVAGFMMSLTILLETREGFDYTSADCASWLRDQGFRDVRAEKLIGSDSFVVGVK
ncbi:MULTISPECIES: methyltransferase [Sorangium]|uniref:Methyltransferase n=1 Tax=Sorangium cellulosum TaxID=56 RepID=A0A4P2QJ93_SORCE|nr:MULTISPECIES: methyltransferase [Sorangium]AUX29691.1 methyltransferase [Sorangium cellulosum]WCQ89080.1 N,N-dimethyltransferase OxyT [Sorangium sp. Soce836]